MASMNKVMLIGRLGQDPEKRTTPSGVSVVNVSLATTDYFKDSSGIRQERTEWHRVVFWSQQADIVDQYTRKGSLIYVEGKLETREWQDKDGNRRFTTNVVCRNMQLLDGRKSSGLDDGPEQSEQAHSHQREQAIPAKPFTAWTGMDDNIPPNKGRFEKQEREDFIEDDIPFK
jgi:single-strand DNA-binding protein